MVIHMKNIAISLLILFTLTSFHSTFKEQQKRYPRVRQAYADKEGSVLELLTQKSIKTEQLRLYIRAFKKEKKIELWGKNASDRTHQLIKEYKVCRTSGDLGPKRKQGDLQIPEGYYHINIFNPASNYYLSLGVNYPNKSDRILGNKDKLGGDIFIHGSCVTIGCIPITDDQIKELYVFCVEAKNSGQAKIPVTIFPSELTDQSFRQLKLENPADTDKLGLWEDLKLGYDHFNKSKTLPDINFLSSGRHRISTTNSE